MNGRHLGLFIGCAFLVLSLCPVGAWGAGPDYRIGIGDTVNIFVWGNPDLGGSGMVRPDGKMSIPLVGDIFVQGMTTEELQSAVVKILKDYIREPVVTIMMSGISSYAFDHKITVLGEVGSPTSIPFREGLNIIDVILSAGWFSPYANMNKVTIIRKEDGALKKISVRFKDIYKKLDLAQIVDMKDGDLVVVP
jgi:polysaccharide export outer membrane protein